MFCFRDATVPVLNPGQPLLRRRYEQRTLSGTAAAGAPIASATITVKDKYGALKTIETGTDGKYSVDVTGMTAPFLLKVHIRRHLPLQHGSRHRHGQHPSLYRPDHKELV